MAGGVFTLFYPKNHKTSGAGLLHVFFPGNPLFRAFLSAAGLALLICGWGAFSQCWAQSEYEQGVRAKWSRFEARWERFRVRGNIPYKGCFEASARQYRLPLPLVLAIAKGESDFNPDAVSRSGAVGLMQILWPKTAAHLGFHQREDLFKPCANIEAGTRYFAELMDLYGDDVFMSLAAYNYGPTALSKGTIPQKAVWYADYIHNQLVLLVSRPWRPTQKGLLRRFSSFEKAAGFARYISRAVPGAELDMQMGLPITFDVYLNFGTVKERDRWLKKIEKKNRGGPRFQDLLNRPLPGFSKAPNRHGPSDHNKG